MICLSKRGLTSKTGYVRKAKYGINGYEDLLSSFLLDYLGKTRTLNTPGMEVPKEFRGRENEFLKSLRKKKNNGKG